MSTKEADHNRGRYYMHTGYVPNPEYRVSRATARSSPTNWPRRCRNLKIPPFVSVGGGSEGPGFLGMTWAPFVVNSNGDVRDLNMGMDQNRSMQRLAMLGTIETDFVGQIASEGRKGTPVVDRRQRSRQDPRQDRQADDQQADGSLQGRFGKDRGDRNVTATPASARAA